MSDQLGVMQKNGKFVVTKNGEPINLPKSDGQTLVTEFSTKEDAERYMGILSTLYKKQTYKNKQRG
jgi:hypothetical protein